MKTLPSVMLAGLIALGGVLAIEALVRRRCDELGLTPPELMRRCGYQNATLFVICKAASGLPNEFSIAHAGCGAWG